MLTTIFKNVRAFIVRIGWVKLAIGALVLILVLWLASTLFGATPAPTEAQKEMRAVAVSSVRDLSLDISPLSVVGTVSSKSEATVRAEVSGQATAVYHALGDTVAAGAIIAEIDNASQRAAVLQAQAGVDAALAAGNVQQTSLKAAQESAATSLLSAYATVQSSLEGGVDDMFANPKSSQPQLVVQTADSQAKTDAENMRVGLNALIAREQAQSTSVSGSDNLTAEITATAAELRTVRDFLDTLIRALNTGVATQGTTESELASYKAAATGARTSVTASLSALIGAQQSLEVAQKNSGAAGSASASLSQAEAGLAAARAQLEKTIIRAPISGTINSLSLKQGDYVQAATPVVTVANNGALEVVAYVTESDAKELAVGSKADMEGGAEGSITRIAPAIDPQTKKIEVRIGITQGSSALTNGQSVTVHFTRSGTAGALPTRVVIPISALKIGAENTVVFTVNSEHKLVAHPVTIGSLLGDRVVIEDGIGFEDTIVTDARGHQAGETVVTQ